jgi:hypothetical protein
MTEQQTTPPQNASVPTERSSRRKRKAKRAPNTLSRGFFRLIDAEIELVGGIVEAAGSGIRAFGEELPERKAAASADWTRSFVSGLSEGSATFLEDISKTVRRTSNLLLEEDEEENEEQD